MEFQGYQDQGGGQAGGEALSFPGRCADRGGGENSGRGGDAADDLTVAVALAEDEATADEADPGDRTRECVGGTVFGEHTDHRSSETDQGEGAVTGGGAAQLTFETQHVGQYERHHQPDGYLTVQGTEATRGLSLPSPGTGRVRREDAGPTGPSTSTAPVSPSLRMLLRMVTVFWGALSH